MINPRDIIKKPLISEKSMDMVQENKYTFIVDPRANKTEIRKAVEELFKVKVTGISTINVKGKTKRVRNIPGRTPDRKKAIVTLKDGDKIEIYDGM